MSQLSNPIKWKRTLGNPTTTASNLCKLHVPSETLMSPTCWYPCYRGSLLVERFGSEITWAEAHVRLTLALTPAIWILACSTCWGLSSLWR